MASKKKTPLQVMQQKVAAINATQVWFKDVTNWAAIFPQQLNKAGNRNMKNWFYDRSRSRQNAAMQKGTSTYINRCALAFDIETYTVPESGNAYMYVWQFLINETVVMGRTWQEFIQLLGIINHYLMLGPVVDKKGRCTEYECKCWIANINFEFGFMKHYLDIERVFAKSASDLLNVATRQGIIFQEALVLAGVTSLKKIPKVYGTPTKKMVGDLDYTKPRNSKTTLTPTEIQYCINDVVILGEFWNYLLATYIDQDCDMPTTRTGVLRAHVKAQCNEWITKATWAESINRLMSIIDLLPISYDEYNKLIKYLFRGGYTHANHINAGDVLENEEINGIDFTSSYPAVMLQELYPRTKFQPIKFNNIQEIVDFIKPISATKRNGMYAKFTFKNVMAKTSHSLESFSKTFEYEECSKNIRVYREKYHGLVDNGRILKTDKLTVMLTDVDLLSYIEYYDFDDDVIIEDAMWSEFAPLPDYVLDGLIMAYNTKATIKKNDPDHDSNPEYTMSKGTVNSGYGMTVQRINIVEFFYNGYELVGEDIAPADCQDKYMETVFGKEWYDIFAQKDYPKMRIINHPRAPKTCLSPFWGIWVTAYARRNLLAMLIQIDPTDALYCDTDSIYIKYISKYQDLIKQYNIRARQKNQIWIDRYNTKHGFDRAYYDSLPDDFTKHQYLTSKGGILFEYFEDLGEFDYVNKAGNYTKFKILGAKRYMKTGPHKKSDGTIEIVTEQTVAGLPKGAIVKYAEEHNLDPYDVFNNNMVIPDCKNGHQYNNDPHDDLIIDEDGNAEMMHEESSVGIFKIDFSMSLTSDYMALLAGAIEDTKRIDYTTGERIDY